MESLGSVYHTRDITAKDIVQEALKVSAVMFFGGHSRNEELFIPRYEFSQMSQKVNNSNYKEWVYKVLSALRLASFDVDEDHLWGLDEPIKTLIPTPILVAHDISKKMGDELASNFSQRAIAEFIKRLKEKRANL